MNDRLPPFNEQAEESALGCMLVSPQALKDGLALLRPSDFFIDRNRWVFEAAQALSSGGYISDFVTIQGELARRLHLDEIGGPAYISHLINNTPTFDGIQSYAQIMRERSADRKLLELASHTAVDAFDGSRTSIEKYARLYDALREIAPVSNHDVSIKSAANELLDEVEMYADNPIGYDEVRGFSLGIPWLDKLTGGLQLDDFTIVTARPGVGKTALLLQAADVLAERGKRVLIYSFEMRQRRVLRRMASRRAKVDWQKIDHGTATSDELARVMRELSQIGDLPIKIVDDNHVTTAMMNAQVDQLRPDLVIVDNINVMLEPFAYPGENDVKRIGRISRNLKVMCNDLLIPVVCICHMNRGSEARADKRPMLSDLRESGELEQNADNVLGMYRDIKGEQQPSNVVEIWPLKLRDGSIDRPVKFLFEGIFYNFIPAETTVKEEIYV